jgi:L-iditol 2-dehydrogenase
MIPENRGERMQAVRLQAVGRVEAVKVPVPSPGPGEVLVRVLAAGICGTDRHLFKGEFPCAPPVTLGHEFSGEVVATGDGVELPTGTRIACDPNIACGTCDQCLRGRVNLCARNIAIGIHRDGGFAEFATLPAHRALEVGDLDPLHAAFAEPLACTLHGVDIGAPVPGDRVIVLGGGVIGLLAVQLARNAGAEVLLVTRNAGKRALALRLGATATAATEAEALALLPGGADLILECAGVTETVEMAPRLTRTGGRIVVLGVLPKGEKVRIEPFDLLFREIQLHHSFLNPFTQGRAIAMLRTHRIDVAPLISRVIPLVDAPLAIAEPALPGEVKVLVVPR